MTQPYSKRTVFAWSLYDFANQPFTTLIVTFIYGTFFTQIIAENEIVGTLLWSRGITITAIIVAFLSPFMGALADRGGYRKLYLIFWTWVSIIGALLLFYPQEGQVVFALIAFIIGNVGFEMGGVFCNAFLPEIAPRDKIGRVSGYGWSFGYVGGLIALTIALLFFIGLPNVIPGTPILNLDQSSNVHIRGTNIMVAIWFALFSIPTFLFVKQEKKSAGQLGAIIKESLAQVKETFHNVRQYREMTKFLIARLIYNDGLITVFAFGGIYAAGTFDFSTADILIFAIVLNITAGFGAFMMGFLDDIIGGKLTIQISNIGLIIACIIAVISPNRDIFIISLPLLGKKMITGKIMFWIAGILIGTFSGSNQSASRSLMARFIPQHKSNEFFGFFAFSGKATAFIGPLFLGYLTQAFGSQRFGVAVVVIFLTIGAFLLHFVDEKSGMDAANI